MTKNENAFEQQEERTMEISMKRFALKRLHKRSRGAMNNELIKSGAHVRLDMAECHSIPRFESLGGLSSSTLQDSS